MISRRTSSLPGRLARGLLIAVALVLAAPPAWAALDARDRADVRRVEAYLNGIRTIRAKFVQIAPDGELSEGVFSLWRPGRIRFEYLPPSPIQVVADGSWLFLYDAELDQTTRVDIDSTPLSVLLGDTIRLDGRISVRNVEREPGVLRLVVRDEEKPERGSITLVFSEKPLKFRQWLVLDAQGLETAVYLSQVEFNPILDAKIFEFVDPNPFREESDR
jgi:outer membrane lipoprotein-sorting protein